MLGTKPLTTLTNGYQIVGPNYYWLFGISQAAHLGAKEE